MKFYSVPLSFLLAFAIVPVVQAESYGFTYSSPGVNLSGTLTATPDSLGDGGYDITGITGNFTNTVGDPVTGAITSLDPGSYNPSSPTDGLFDDLFYPAGNAPGYGGGDFDIWGVTFFVGGNTPEDVVNLSAFSNVYYLGDSTSATLGSYYSGTFEAAPTVTPEPSPLWLLATGLAGLVAVRFRKSKRPAALNI